MTVNHFYEVFEYLVFAWLVWQFHMYCCCVGHLKLFPYFICWQ